MSRRSWQMTSHARAETVWTEVSSHGEVPSHSRIEIPFYLEFAPSDSPAEFVLADVLLRFLRITTDEPK